MAMGAMAIGPAFVSMFFQLFTTPAVRQVALHTC
jgi:hypothetical protein